MDIGSPDSHHPSQDAVAARNALIDATEAQRDVLLETLDSADDGTLSESGRSLCGPDGTLPAEARFPTAVTLQECPRSATAIMHTHVTQDQLLAPEHSLPDMANVLFEGVSASMIVGIEQHDIMQRPADPAPAQRAFSNALGFEIRSTRDVVGARKRQQIHDPADARSRVRSALAPLFERVESPHSELASRVDQGAIPAFAPGEVGGYIPEIDTYDYANTHADTFRQSQDAGRMLFSQATPDGISVTQEAASTAIGVVVGEVVKMVFFK